MSISLKRIFKKDKSIVIGSLHFPPLLGEKGFPGLKRSLQMALQDLRAYEAGGVDGLFLENNYGLSKEKITPAQLASMGYLIGEIRSRTTLPMGASVLWNDFESALALAHTYDLKFIRIPVFVDEVETYCGVIKGDLRAVKRTRNTLEANDVALFTDILVKHSKHISTHTLATAAKKAIKAGSDAVIVTGDWTGQAPSAETVQALRASIDDFPILVGSGANTENVADLLTAANGVIVSTSLKAGTVKKGEQNVKGYEQRVLPSKVKAFVKKAQ